MNSPTVGTALKSLLERHGLTQDDLAKKIGVARPTVSQWITGKAKIRGRNARAIANALNVHLIDLIEEIGITPDAKLTVELRDTAAQLRVHADSEERKWSDTHRLFRARIAEEWKSMVAPALASAKNVEARRAMEQVLETIKKNFEATLPLEDAGRWEGLRKIAERIDRIIGKDVS